MFESLIDFSASHSKHLVEKIHECLPLNKRGKQGNVLKQRSLERDDVILRVLNGSRLFFWQLISV